MKQTSLPEVQKRVETIIRSYTWSPENASDVDYAINRVKMVLRESWPTIARLGPRPCGHCGESFTPFHPRQVYCTQHQGGRRGRQQ